MKTTLMLFLVIILTSSCATTDYYSQKFPVIEKPDRPKLSPALDKDDFKAMVKYAKKLEVSIDIYNEFAEIENKKLDDQFKERSK